MDLLLLKRFKESNEENKDFIDFSNKYADDGGTGHVKSGYNAAKHFK